jgi:hypothetical protein
VAADEAGNMSKVLTKDAVIEYPTQRAGMLLTVEGASRIRNFSSLCDGSGALMHSQPPLEAKNNSSFEGVPVKE